MSARRAARSRWQSAKKLQLTRWLFARGYVRERLTICLASLFFQQQFSRPPAVTGAVNSPARASCKFNFICETFTRGLLYLFTVRHNDRSPSCSHYLRRLSLGLFARPSIWRRHRSTSEIWFRWHSSARCVLGASHKMNTKATPVTNKPNDDANSYWGS